MTIYAPFFCLCVWLGSSGNVHSGKQTMDEVSYMAIGAGTATGSATGTAVAESLMLPKYSIGVGDRFAHQAKAQLAACMKASAAGVEVTPVWNKSNREHMIIGSD